MSCLLVLPKNALFVDVNEILRDWKHKKVIIDFSNIESTLPAQMLIHLAFRYMYTFNKYITQPSKHCRTVVLKNVPSCAAYEVDKQQYIYRTRELINEPANIATPEYIAAWARDAFKDNAHVKLEIWDEDELTKQGLNLVMAVGKASKNQPRLVKIEYTPPKYTKTICLCGKGVTFDAGGLNIKTGDANSFRMKGDKTGGCIVLGILKYFADHGISCRIIGLVPLVENIISADVTHAGDIVKSFSGKTVEILDTDAEGRLILADVLSYSARYNPNYIIDIATLTGWSSSLHCDTSAIFFSPNTKLHALIERVGEKIGERTWGMPKWLDYMRYCKSNVADLKNHDLKVHQCKSGSGYMAAMFLAHFVPRKCLNNWVHFDVTNNVDKYMNANTMNLVIEMIRSLSSPHKMK